MKTKIETLVLVDQEIRRQDEKWGPDRTHPDLHIDSGLDDGSWFHIWKDSSEYKRTTENRAKDGTISWADILVEEVAEALDEPDPQKRIDELVQVAAVALQWVNDLIIRSENP